MDISIHLNYADLVLLIPGIYDRKTYTFLTKQLVSSIFDAQVF